MIAVLDTGIDYNHPDLAANVWSAPTSFTVIIGGNQVTCPAGSHGYNTVAGSCDPRDDNNHGTHVAGTIGAVGNNNIGSVGVNWTTRIMALKILDGGGIGTVADAISAIDFAIQVKTQFASSSTPVNVRVLSNSWGGDTFSQALLDEINLANANEMLFVAAAGNGGGNNDSNPTYPASYMAPNVISVTATDNQDALAGFSNYGNASVHLAAPGVGIYSTYPNASYSHLSGTSMAAPHVSGAAMLVLANCGSLSTASLKGTLLANVDVLPSLAGKTITGGRLNVNQAVRNCITVSSPFTLTSSPSTVSPGGAITVSWTAPSSRTPQDRIALYTVGGQTLLNAVYTGGTASGSLTFTAPATLGQYEFRYLMNDTMMLAATSNTVTVSAPSASSFTLTATPSSTSPGGAITVTWTASSSRTSRDWIALYMVGGGLLASGYTGGTASGTLNFVAPAVLGQYEFRYLMNDSLVLAATSNIVTVSAPSTPFTLTATPSSVTPGGTIAVSWTAPSSRTSRDWIALYMVGGGLLASGYTGGTAGGTVNFTAPAAPGQYEFRYLMNDSLVLAATSNTVTVGTPSTPFTLTATPSNVTPGGTIAVNWTAPSSRTPQDRIALYTVGGQTLLNFAYTGGTATGTLTFTAPATPGQYEFRYLMNDTMMLAATSNVFTVSVPSTPFTLTATPSSVTPGGAITVSWTAPSSRTPQDRIALYTVGGQTLLNAVYTGGTASGSLTFTAPATLGQYEFRYLMNDSLVLAATSNIVTVSASSTPFTLTATPSSTSPGGAITVTWTASSSRTSRDWIALYMVGGGLLASGYTGGTASGTLNFVAPAVLGQYEFRYLMNDSLVLAATSNIVTVSAPSTPFTLTATPSSVTPGGTIAVSWTAPSSRTSRDWIALYMVGGGLLASGYTGGTAGGTVNFTAPAAPGQYEFRYLMNDSLVLAATSNTVTVGTPSTPFTLTATPSSVTPGGTIAVNWTAPSSRTPQDRIALYTVGGQTLLNFAYTGGTATSTLTFTAPATPGQYEFRYLMNDTMMLAATSNTVTVSAPSTSSFTLTATPSSTSPGGAITVTWTASSSRTSRDWIALYMVGGGLLASGYTGGTASGTLNFVAPAVLGQYEFRYLMNDSLVLAATSNIVTVSAPSTPFTLTATPSSVTPGGTIAVSWTAPSSRTSRDWIALYMVGGGLLASGYTGGTAGGTVNFTAPAVLGQYEFRYLMNDSLVLAATSNTVTVQ